MAGRHVRERVCTLGLAALVGAWLVGCTASGPRLSGSSWRKSPTKDAPAAVTAQRPSPSDKTAAVASLADAAPAIPEPTATSSDPNLDESLMPAGDQRVRVVGTRLSRASQRPDIPFAFDTLTNPRPRTHHTDNGRIYVTSGLLAQSTTDEDLAALLALEMALVMAEHDQAGKPRGGLKGAETVGPSKENKEVQDRAQKLLDDAGYQTVQIAEVRDRILRTADRKSPARLRGEDSPVRKLMAQ